MNPIRRPARAPRFLALTAFVFNTLCSARLVAAPPQTGFQAAPRFHGVATRAPANMKIDGDLAEFKDAFCTPVNYFDSRLRDRAGQFLYLWDDEAFYAGLRTLDTKPFSGAPDDRLWEGDGVEWYFDTRQGPNFAASAWPTNESPGAVHCYWTGLTGGAVKPRFCLRPGFLQAIPKIGVQVGARRTRTGLEVEFKLPWANFPGFKPQPGTIIAVDAELCYSDGGPRVDRFFAYGSPLSVQQPASLAPVQLVGKLEPQHWRQCAPVLCPIRCDVTWNQKTKPEVTGLMALPPGAAEWVDKVVFRLVGTRGEAVGEFPGAIQVFEKEGDFRRAQAQWPLDLAAPGSYNVIGIIYGKAGKELGRVAPRMVSTGMKPGY